MINRRVNVRRDLHPLYLPYYDALCGELSETVEWTPPNGTIGLYSWEPLCGFRAFDAQDRDFAKGRELVNNIWVVREPEKVVTRARGGESPHQYKCASDWCLYDMDGVAHWPPSDHPLWKDYVAAVTAVGLRPGSEWGDWDHNELRINTSWKTIHQVLINHGPTAVDAAIQAALVPPNGGQS